MSRRFFRSVTESAPTNAAAAAAASVVAFADISDLDTVSEFSCNPNNNWDILTEIDEFLEGYSTDKALLPHMTNKNSHGPTKLHSKNIKVEPLSPPSRKSNRRNANLEERLHRETSNSSSDPPESSSDSSCDSTNIVSNEQDEQDSDFNNFQGYNKAQLPYRVKIEPGTTEINSQNQGLNKNNKPYLNHKPLIDTNQTEVNTQHKEDQDDRWLYVKTQTNDLESSNLPTHSLYRSKDLSYQNNHRQQLDEWRHRGSYISTQQNKSFRSKCHNKPREKSLTTPNDYINPYSRPKEYNLQSKRLKKSKNTPKNIRGINKPEPYSMYKKFKDHGTGIINSLITQSNSQILEKTNRMLFDNFQKPSIPPLSTKTNGRSFNNFKKPSVPPLSTNKLSNKSNEHYKNPHDSLNNHVLSKETQYEHNDSTWLRDHDQPYWEHVDAPVLTRSPDIPVLSTEPNDEPLNNFRTPSNRPLSKKKNRQPFNNFKKPSIPPLSTNNLSHASNEHYKNPHDSLNHDMPNRDKKNNHNGSTRLYDHDQPYREHIDAPYLSTKMNEEPLNNYQKPYISRLSTNKPSCTSNEHNKYSQRLYEQPMLNNDTQNEHDNSIWRQEQEQNSYWKQTEADVPVLPSQPVNPPLLTITNEEPFNRFKKQSISPLSTNKPSCTLNEHYKNPSHSLNQHSINRDIPNEHNDSTCHQEREQVTYRKQTEADAPVLPSQPVIPPLLTIAKEESFNRFQKQSISPLSTNKPSCTLNEHHKNPSHSLNQHSINRDIPNEHNDSTCHQEREQVTYRKQTETDANVLASQPVIPLLLTKTNEEPLNKFRKKSKSPLSTNKLSDSSNELYKNSYHTLNQRVLNNEIPIEYDDSMQHQEHGQICLSYHTESEPVLPSMTDIPSLLTNTDEKKYNNFQKVSKSPLLTNKQHDNPNHLLNQPMLNIETPNKLNEPKLNNQLDQISFYFHTEDNVSALPCTLDVPPLSTKTNEEPLNNFQKPSITRLSTNKTFCTSNEHNKYPQRLYEQPMLNNDTQNEHDDSIWCQGSENVPNWGHTEADFVLPEMHYSTDMYFDTSDMNIEDFFDKSENSIVRPQDRENNSANDKATHENMHKKQAINNCDDSIRFDVSNPHQFLIKDYLSPESLSGCIIKFKPRKMINTITRDKLQKAFKEHGPIVSSWWTPDDQYYLTYRDRSIAEQVYTVYPKNTTNSY